MIKGGKAVEIWCDVPGCGFGELLILPSFVELARALQVPVAIEREARKVAETRGWFHEVIEVKGLDLARDVCPRQASGYRTLLAARKSPAR